MSINILSKELELLKKDLIAVYDAKGMRASGRFADSLETSIFNTENGYTGILIGEDYAQQLETGRKSGSYPPIEAIKQWIVDKGIFSEALNKMKISSLAFLIARKINEKGWNRAGYGGVNLVSDVVTEERIQSIIDEIGAVEAYRVESEIINLIEAIAV